MITLAGLVVSLLKTSIQQYNWTILYVANILNYLFYLSYLPSKTIEKVVSIPKFVGAKKKASQLSQLQVENSGEG